MSGTFSFWIQRVALGAAAAVLATLVHIPPSEAATAGPVPAVAVPGACSPKNGSFAVTIQTACISGTNWRTRQRITKAWCFSAITALHFMVYPSSGCKSGGNNQIESIAQARMVARLDHDDEEVASKNSEPTVDDPTPEPQINPDIQWEVGIPKAATGPSNYYPDIIKYDSESETPSLDPISVVELKVSGTKTLEDIQTQVDDYRREIEDQNGQGRKAVLYSKPYFDAFGVLQGCTANGGAGVALYESSLVADGIVIVKKIATVRVPGLVCGEVPEALPRSVLEAAAAAAGVAAAVKALLDKTYGGSDGSAPAPGGSPTTYQPPPGPDEGCTVPLVCGPQLHIPSEVLVAGAIAVATAVLCVAACPILAAALATALEGVTVFDAVSGLFSVALAAWAIGDPHMRTLDGRSYDMQSEGEFHLLEAPDFGADFQGRFAPWASAANVSVLKAVAVDVDGYAVEVRDGDLYVNGQQTKIEQNGMLTFGDDSFVAYRDGKYAIGLMSSGANDQPEEVVGITDGSSIGFAVPAGVATSGLVGDHDGDPTNDLRLSDGPPVAESDPGAIEGPFADSWRITDLESTDVDS